MSASEREYIVGVRTSEASPNEHDGTPVSVSEREYIVRAKPNEVRLNEHDGI